MIRESRKEDLVTLQYYNKNADCFASSTVQVDFTKYQNKFLSCLPEGAKVLDFGCGSGRDTKYFHDQGCQVDAIDGSEELCQFAREYTGLPVRHAYFQELDAVSQYDGVWACSSILHVKKRELPQILKKISTALKPNGILYTSFKYGDFEGVRNGRYFTYLTEESLKKMLEQVGDFEIQEIWRTGDVREGRGEEVWLNMILRKK